MKRALAVVLSSLLVISIFVIIPGFPKAHAGTFPGVNGKIAFVHNDQIYVVNPDGSDLTNLTDNQVGGSYPSWSPDGSKIAITGIRVMNADGTTDQISDGFDFDPSWSPDGSKIAFVRDATPSIHQIWVMNADGTNRINISNNSFDDLFPSWSPDGTKIAFTRELGGGIIHKSIKSIFVMDADGTNQVNLSKHGGDENPSWSPDGSKIAFTSQRHSLDPPQIWVMNADGTNQSNLSNSSKRDRNPSWSPDGTKIAFESFIVGHGLEIVIMDADGTNRNPILTTGNIFNPDWGPLFLTPESEVNALLADEGAIGLGQRTNLVQKIDASSGATGTLLSLQVLEPNGDRCIANGLPKAIPASGILSREYPTDFSRDSAIGDLTCNTFRVGVYKAESEVEVGGVVSKSTVEFETNFFVIPESPVGAAALIGSSLAALGGFMYFRRH